MSHLRTVDEAAADLLHMWQIYPPRGWSDAKAASEAFLWLEASIAKAGPHQPDDHLEAGRVTAAAIWAAWCRYRDEVAS